MKPNEIFDVLDLTRRARAIDEVFNPMFVSPPGVGKSSIVQQWCNLNNIPFIDLRLAYFESTDLVGFPSIENRDGRQVTTHNIPDLWPMDPDWEGVLLLEEPNRALPSTMNAVMQLLTDRKVHKYVLPKKALIVSCINPEDGLNDVQSMDPALRDRFEIFEVNYDKNAFIKYMKERDWDRSLIEFVETGSWQYSQPQDIGTVPGSKYISPRTLSKVNAALKAKIPNEDLELTIFISELGTNTAKAFYAFRHDESPVTFEELINNKRSALKRLSKFSDPSNCKNGHISLTIRSIVENGSISDELLCEVLKIIPVDQGPSLINDLEFKRKDNNILKRLCNAYPDLLELFKSVLKK